MKRVLIFSLIFLNIAGVNAEVINAPLEDLLKIGIENNNDIKIKRLELAAVEKDIKIAGKLQNPQIQSNVVFGNVALGNCSQAGLTLPVEVLKRGVRKKIAQEKYLSKEIELKQFEHNYKLQLMKAYFDVLYAKSVYKIQEDRLKLFKSLVQITTDMPSAGSSYEIDNLKADIQYAAQKIELNRAKADMLAKQFELNKILNTGDDSKMYDTEEDSLFNDWGFLSIKIPDYEYIEKTALQYSYIIQISEKDIKTSELQLKAAGRNRIPDISISGGYAWQAHPDAPINYGGAFAGLGMDLPILYNYTPDIQKADLFLQRSKANKKMYEYQLKFALKKDYNYYKYSAENMAYAKQILEDSKKIVRLSTKNYISGKHPYSVLVINEKSHQDILASYLTAMSNHFYSYLELMQDIGHDILVEEELL